MSQHTTSAGSARAGVWYTTPRGSRVKVLGRLEGSTDVQLENEHGRAFTVIESYPLLAAVAGAPDLDALAGRPLDEIRAALPNLNEDDLDALEDLDPRPEVLELTASARRELEAESGPVVVQESKPTSGHRIPEPPPAKALAPTVHQAPGAPPVMEDPEPSPTPAEIEDEDEPAGLDPLRHLDGATTAPDRIEAVRRIAALASLDELDGIRDQLQTKVGRELDRQRKALEAIEAAGVEALAGRPQGLSRLADRQDYQGRPGVMARARALFAQAQGRGATVDHRIQPVDPSELEAPPEVLTSATAPADLSALVDWLMVYYDRREWRTAWVQAIADMTGTVRGSRAALQGIEDVGLIRAAWVWEATQDEPRATILDQIAARIVALGGEVPERPDPRQRRITDPVEDEPAADAHPIDAAAHALANGATAAIFTIPDEPAPEPAPVEAEPTAEAPPEPVEPWDLGDLPLPMQIARSVTARALELVAELPAHQLADAVDAEHDRQDGARAVVLAAIQRRWTDVASRTQVKAPTPAELPPEIEAAGPERAETAQPRPEPPLGGRMGSQVEAGASALRALADALPSLAAELRAAGLDLEIRITTRQD